jgi:hypothetical protein
MVLALKLMAPFSQIARSCATRFPEGHTVIASASEAIHSSFREPELDCFVAFAPRSDDGESPQPSTGSSITS